MIDALIDDWYDGMLFVKCSIFLLFGEHRRHWRALATSHPSASEELAVFAIVPSLRCHITDIISSASMPMSIILPSPPLLRIQLNQRINPHDRHTRLHRAFQLAYLAHTGLQHSRLHAIHHLALG